MPEADYHVEEATPGSIRHSSIYGDNFGTTVELPLTSKLARLGLL